MQKIAILYDASQAVLSTFDLDEVLRQILWIMRDYFQLQNAAVLLLEPESQLYSVRCQNGWTEDRLDLRVAPGEGVIGSAVERKRPLHVADFRAQSKFSSPVANTRSELAIPLMLRDEVVGVLDCQSDKQGFFDKETIDLLTLFSTQASIAIQNAQLYALEQRRARQLETINAIARHTTCVTDIQELLDKVCELVHESFAADHVALLLREDDKLVLRAQNGRLTPLFEQGAALPTGPSLCLQAVCTNEPVIVDDVTSEPNYVVGFRETRSEVVLPLISFGESVGLLTLEGANPRRFQRSDLGPLESVADICAAAIQNARYLERVRELAYRDGLTGVFNRRFFENRILEEVERARRYKTKLSVVMLDIDGFKPLNDEFGHLLGDEVLKQLSAVFVQHTRKSDVVCRFGGDEFAILLPETSSERASAVADKLRRIISVREFPGVPRPVTISTGIAEYPIHGETRDDLIRAADAALYTAKQAGRNQVVVAN